MADAPERIWNAARVEELSTRLRDRAEVARSEPTMTARCDADHFIEAADAIEALFIRADLVDELVKALERAEPYLLDAINEHVEKIKALAGYDKMVARQEAYKRGVEEDRDLIRAALTRIKGDGK